MTTLPNIFKRFHIKPAKKNPDWARVEEPDRFDVLYLSIIGIVVTGFLALMAWLFLTNNMIEWVAVYLASFNNDMTFTQRLAAFGIGVIVFVNMLITLVFVLFAQVGNDDIVEMLSDLDANTQERMVELEQTLREETGDISKKLDDLVVTK